MSVSRYVIFHPSCTIVYKSFDSHKKRKQTNKNSLKNLATGALGKYNGEMSDATKRKCKKMINNFLLCHQFSGQPEPPTFVTLTLPAKQKHDDKEIKKKMFSDWFIPAMKRNADTKHYFWRAEPQKNGNIHFHIIFDKFIPWQNVRGTWNNILGSYGYLEDYKNNQLSKHPNGFTYDPSYQKNKSRQGQYKRAKRAKRTNLTFRKWDEQKQFEAYDYGMKTNWKNPNSTDIHRLKKIRNVGAYVTKYMTKTNSPADFLANPNLRIIKGRIWGASDTIRDLKYPTDCLEVLQYVDGEEQLQDFNPDLAVYLEELDKDSRVERKDVNEMVSVYLLHKTQKETLAEKAPLFYQDYVNYYKTQSKILYP